MILRNYKLLAFLLTLCAGTVALPQEMMAHCQIPCGIYDDHARIRAMLEEAATVKKAIVQLAELAGKIDALKTYYPEPDHTH